MSDPKQEYDAALVAYREARVRLKAAKAALPETPLALLRRRWRENEAARQREADQPWIDDLIRREIELVHKMSEILTNPPKGRPGDSIRIRMPISYTVKSSNE